MPQETTGTRTHIATEKGYAGGVVVQIGEAVPPGVPVGLWMEKSAAAQTAPEAGRSVIVKEESFREKPLS